MSFGKIESEEEEKDEMKRVSGAKGQAKKTTKRFAHSKGDSRGKRRTEKESKSEKE